MDELFCDDRGMEGLTVIRSNTTLRGIKIPFKEKVYLNFKLPKQLIVSITLVVINSDM